MLRCLCTLAFVLLLQVPNNEARTKEEEKYLLQEAGKMLFQLYTRKNPIESWDFELNDLEYLQYSPLNASRPTVVLTHGWNCYWGSAFNILMRNALLIQHDVNVIIVSWDLTSTLFYFAAKNYVPTAGKVVALMVDRLVTESSLNLQDIHIIGHSLGAHVAGVAGLFTTVGKLPRVTGYKWNNLVQEPDNLFIFDHLDVSAGPSNPDDVSAFTDLIRNYCHYGF